MQGTDTKSKEYKNIEVPERGLVFGERMIIVNDDDNNLHTNNKDLTVMSSTVVKSYREKKYKSHYMVVYVLPKRFSG